MQVPYSYWFVWSPRPFPLIKLVFIELCAQSDFLVGQVRYTRPTQVPPCRCSKASQGITKSWEHCLGRGLLCSPRAHEAAPTPTVSLLFCPCRSWKPVAEYIDQQFEQYFRDESGLNRKNIQDNRVHCCLYFISPFGHGYGPSLRLLTPPGAAKGTG